MFKGKLKLENKTLLYVLFLVLIMSSFLLFFLDNKDSDVSQDIIVDPSTVQLTVNRRDLIAGRICKGLYKHECITLMKNIYGIPDKTFDMFISEAKEFDNVYSVTGSRVVWNYPDNVWPESVSVENMPNLDMYRISCQGNKKVCNVNLRSIASFDRGSNQNAGDLEKVLVSISESETEYTIVNNTPEIMILQKNYNGVSYCGKEEIEINKNKEDIVINRFECVEDPVNKVTTSGTPTSSFELE